MDWWRWWTMMIRQLPLAPALILSHTTVQNNSLTVSQKKKKFKNPLNDHDLKILLLISNRIYKFFFFVTEWLGNYTRMSIHQHKFNNYGFLGVATRAADFVAWHLYIVSGLVLISSIKFWLLNQLHFGTLSLLSKTKM